MPTDAEISALVNNCTTTWTTQNGVYGGLVTGKGAYADRSIFLPAAGFGYDSNLDYHGSEGYCWSSTPDSDNSNAAWDLNFYAGGFYVDYNSPCTRCTRYYGQYVRPVRGFAE